MSAHVRRGFARSYHARMTSSPPSPEASGSDADADRLAAASPTPPAAELARIAASRPDLHPTLAINPATYPDLVDWLRTSPDPAVQTALAQRATTPAQTRTDADEDGSARQSGRRFRGRAVGQGRRNDSPTYIAAQTSCDRRRRARGRARARRWRRLRLDANPPR